jgi:hypothetical protein
MELTVRLRRWLWLLCRSRSAQCSPTLRQPSNQDESAL